MKNSLPFVATLAAVMSMLCVAAGFSSGSRTQSKPAYQTTGSEGVINGKVTFAGKPPAPKQIDTSADPVCTEANPYMITDWVIVTRGKLANTLVYVRSGDALEWYSFEAPAADVSLTHKNCQYAPHVLAMQIQQTLKVENADATAHNTHFLPKANADSNQSQPAGAPPLELKFKSPEVAFAVKDNQHPWEKAYVSIFTHPFFAVSRSDGSYKISGLPPGQYTIVAWHERFGEQTAEISVGVRAQVTQDFVFKEPEK